MRKTLLAVLLLLIFATTAAAGMAPLNPKFIEWRDSRLATDSADAPTSASTSSRPPAGVIPMPFNTDVMKDKSIVPSASSGARLQAITIPTASTYDLRDQGYVTPVRNQGNYGTCWTFSTMAACESSALKQGIGSYDFSEKHLAYFGYTDVDSEYVSYDKDPNQAYPYSVYDLGGYYLMACSILSRWTGIVSEADEPYSNMGPSEADYFVPAGTPPSAYAPNTMQLTDLVYAPEGSSVVDNIKYLLANYGAVGINVDAGDGSNNDPWDTTYYNPTTAAFYAYGSTDTNHAVTVVGWDDTYSKTNFLVQPSIDGAFIVRNSWGTDFGDSGYFYVSYDDPGIYEEGGWAFKVDQFDENRRMYFYDPLGLVNAGHPDDGVATRQWAANIFEAQGNDKLEKIAFFLPAPDVTVTILVYTGVQDNAPRSGTLAYRSDATQFDLFGYHTVDLPSAIQLDADEKFSIVLRFDCADGGDLIAFEYPDADESTSKASASAGESFVSGDGGAWKDSTKIVSGANVCIRGIATPGGSGGAVLYPLLLNN